MYWVDIQKKQHEVWLLKKDESWRKNQKEQHGTECFFQVQVACNYKAIKQRLHLEVKATWARDTASFFLWTYGITAPDGWRVIWEQNRHLLRMQMSLPLWVARDLQESWHFCRFRYLLIKPFKRGKGGQFLIHNFVWKIQSILEVVYVCTLNEHYFVFSISA